MKHTIPELPSASSTYSRKPIYGLTPFRHRTLSVTTTKNGAVVVVLPDEGPDLIDNVVVLEIPGRPQVDEPPPASAPTTAPTKKP